MAMIGLERFRAVQWLTSGLGQSIAGVGLNGLALGRTYTGLGKFMPTLG
jgi:hypothetical protein